VSCQALADASGTVILATAPCILISNKEFVMLNVLIVSEQTFGKNLIASEYLKALGGEYFTVECAGFETGPLHPVVTIIMKLDGYDLTNCDCPHSVSELLEMGRRYDIVITICPKRLDEKCPDFPGQLLRLNWGHADPDKVAESRIDRLQQTRIMRDSIKADVINFINEYKSGELPGLKQAPG
jgi:arsenate reductase (thioredoxin)